MANTHNHHHHPRKPRRVHAPSQRAQGLDPEFTAQPHGLSDDIDLSSDEAGLSIDTEDLGNHFLSEAVEQGDAGARGAAELEFALHADEISAEYDLGVWETMTDRAIAGGGSSDELRDAADFGADDLAAARDQERKPAPSRSLNLHDSSIRESSLLDREGAELNETIAPRVDSDDTGRHARSTSRDALGEQVSGTRAAADSGRRRTGKLQAAARASLRSAAGKLRGMAAQLARARRR